MATFKGNVGKYSLHGAFGLYMQTPFEEVFGPPNIFYKTTFRVSDSKQHLTFGMTGGTG